MKLNPTLIPAATCLLVFTSPSMAQQSEASMELSADGFEGSSDFDGPGDSGGGARPLQYQVELGLYAGAMFPLSDHSLRVVGNPYQDFDPVAFDFGGRLGLYPIAYVGVEGEAGMLPTRTENGNSASLYTLRGHLIGQLPTKHVTPFLLVGGGRLYLDSDALGTESDRAVHFGLGAKIPFGNEHWLARVDVRDTITFEDGSDDVDHWPEVLLGVSYGFDVIGGKKEAPPPRAPIDTDGDGKPDDVDACPSEPADTPDGCPVRDTDQDGVPDPDDECPNEKGDLPNGCPNLDEDGDGIPLPDDQCPTEPGIAPDGCPDPDADKDGIPIPDDRCPDEPETVNDYEDSDGCPDEIPDAVKEFTGVIKGINFATGKATVTPDSFALLDRAVGVLQEHQSLRLLIVGHTDSTGTRDRNVELSQARADAVKAYLTGKGVDGARLDTRGAGPDEPIADNKTREGRAENRRIEFTIVK